VTERLAELCERAGIESAYVGIDGLTHTIPEETLVALVDALDADTGPADPPPTSAEVLADLPAKRCFVPAELEDARVWGITCQLPSLVSARNAGIGDFADLATLCDIAAAEGADFVGVNPLHALFWSDPARTSPFFPSNRRFLNPLYIALDWVDGFSRLPKIDTETSKPTASPLIDVPPVAAHKDQMLRKLFDRYPWDAAKRKQFDAFRQSGGEALHTHALFEAISEAMVGNGLGVTPPSWPEDMRTPISRAATTFAEEHRDLVDYHLWLQWQARLQLGRAQERAHAAGLRIGLYVDCAVGAAPDGSAAWGAPELTLSNVSIGAPPDPFSVFGQDWGLAPMSPARLAALDGKPLAEILTATAGGSGAIRIDHAMGLARMWLIPRGSPAIAGAYVRYPLRSILERLADVSHAQKTIVIGEDLGVVPAGFRALMSANAIHSYKLLLTERDEAGFADPVDWPVNAMACFATHDMPTIAGWWRGTDLDVRRALGLLSVSEFAAEWENRIADKAMLATRIGHSMGNAEDPSIGICAAIASSPCRLAALQIEDALGVLDQVNIPGTMSEYPNWRRRLPVNLEELAGNATFRAHTRAMRRARPK
jgi:4-alpha-glucanotransferase